MKPASKSALVTGASNGLGAAIAMRLASDGFHVLAHGRDMARGNAVVQSILDSGGSAEFIPGDVLSMDDIGKVSAHCLAGRPSIDLLVNNAGGGGEHQDWWSTTPDKWKWAFDMNVFSAAEFCRLLVPHMIEAGRGRVINIASIAAIQPLDIGPEYAAAKAAVIAMTISLAKACAHTGVTCNSISPGLLDHSRIAHGLTEDAFPTLSGRLPTKEHVAGLVSFLASDDAASITGENVVVDAGYRHITPQSQRPQEA